jgi:8-oxo-dGTP pyrophosphatase MutT (NUDIX family)
MPTHTLAPRRDGDPDPGLARIRSRLRPLHAVAGLRAQDRPRHSDFDLNRDDPLLNRDDPLSRRHRAPARTRLREAAVLVPLVQHAAGTTVLLTRRTEHLTHHAGQVSFPGGRVEDRDPSFIATALRETGEEIGLQPGHLDPVGLLDDYETVTGFLVTPVVAAVRPGFSLRVDAGEVAEVFEVPLRFLLDPANHHVGSRVRDGVQRRFFEFRYERHTIWGATAGMLMNLYRRLHGLSGPQRP